jgi:hypothetical protein
MEDRLALAYLVQSCWKLFVKVVFCA